MPIARGRVEVKLISRTGVVAVAWRYSNEEQNKLNSLRTAKKISTTAEPEGFAALVFLTKSSDHLI
jgi:hypothetical protein